MCRVSENTGASSLRRGLLDPRPPRSSQRSGLAICWTGFPARDNSMPTIPRVASQHSANMAEEARRLSPPLLADIADLVTQSADTAGEALSSSLQSTSVPEVMASHANGPREAEGSSSRFTSVISRFAPVLVNTQRSKQGANSHMGSTIPEVATPSAGPHTQQSGHEGDTDVTFARAPSLHPVGGPRTVECHQGSSSLLCVAGRRQHLSKKFREACAYALNGNSTSKK